MIDPTLPLATHDPHEGAGVARLHEVPAIGSTETMTLNFGPQHPSTHGVFHMRVELSGETVVSVTPIIGYLHRGMEKLMESRTYAQGGVLIDRFDYVSAFSNELAYSRAIETLGGYEVPERASYLRTVMAEMVRISSHLVWLASVGLDMGSWGALLYAFVERERLLDFFEQTSGARMMFNYIRPGGLREDVPKGWEENVYRYLSEEFPKKVDDFEDLLTDNEILKARLIGLTPMTTEQALAWGITGPILRATGLARDLRKDAPYEAYDKIDFEVPTAVDGDCYDRYKVRIAEFRESAKMICKLLDKTPAEGETRSKVPRTIKLPEGEVYVRTESPRGDQGVYLVSDGGTNPYRMHWRSPAMINISAVQRLAAGTKIADLIVVAGSLDLVMGEVDR